MKSPFVHQNLLQKWLKSVQIVLPRFQLRIKYPWRVKKFLIPIYIYLAYPLLFSIYPIIMIYIDCFFLLRTCKVKFVINKTSLVNIYIVQTMKLRISLIILNFFRCKKLETFDLFLLFFLCHNENSEISDNN